MDKFFAPSSVDFISYRAPKPTQYGTVVVESVPNSGRSERKSHQTHQQPEPKAATFEEREAALERSKKSFLEAWNDYIDFLRTETERNERKTLQAKHEDKVSQHNRNASAGLESDISTLPVHGKLDCKNLLRLIENTRNYTTNPKFSEWEHGITQSLPHLEEAADKLQTLQFETAERDIIDAIRIGVNTPFAQLVRCQERQKELHHHLVKGMPEDSCPEFLIAIWNEFQVNHKERKIKQSLDLVRRLDSGLQDAQANFHQRVESFGELKGSIRATLNPDDPLNLSDYEPPHEEAIAKLRAIERVVFKSQQAWEADLQRLERAFDADNSLADLKRQEVESAELAASTRTDLEAAQEEVQRCWDALIAAQSKCKRAETRHAAAKVQEELNKKLVEEVSGQVESQKRMLEESVASCDVYCEVLKHVEDYINTRWAAWLGQARGETGRLVAAVCALYSFSEQALGDLLDRKQSQVDHAAKEEKDCTEKYLSKWEQLDRHADAEMERALEHRRVKEAARAEAQHYGDVRAGIRRLMELCRPSMAEFGVSVTGAELQSAVEEWDKRRIRLYNELEGLSQPVIKKACVVGQTADHPETSTVSRPLLPVDEDLRLINALLLSAPSVLAAPPGSAASAGLVDRQRKTAGDMLIRAEYVAEEVTRQGGHLGGESAGQALESGVAALRRFIDSLKAGSTASTTSAAAAPASTAAKSAAAATTTPAQAPPSSASAAGAKGSSGPPPPAASSKPEVAAPASKDAKQAVPSPPSEATQTTSPAPKTGDARPEDPAAAISASAASTSKKAAAPPAAAVGSAVKDAAPPTPAPSGSQEAAAPAAGSKATPTKDAKPSKEAAASAGKGKGAATAAAAPAAEGQKAAAGASPSAAPGIKSRPMDAFLDSLESEDGRS